MQIPEFDRGINKISVTEETVHIMTQCGQKHWRYLLTYQSVHQCRYHLPLWESRLSMNGMKGRKLNQVFQSQLALTNTWTSFHVSLIIICNKRSFGWTNLIQ